MQLCPGMDALVGNAVGGTELGEVNVLGGGKKVLEGGIELGDGQHFEDAAAVVINQDDGEVPDEVAVQQEAIGVVEQGEVSGQQNAGLVVVGDADCGGKGTIDAVGSPVEKGTGGSVAGCPEPFGVADGHAFGDEEGGAVGQDLGEQPGGFALEQGFGGLQVPIDGVS